MIFKLYLIIRYKTEDHLIKLELFQPTIIYIIMLSVTYEKISKRIFVWKNSKVAICFDADITMNNNLAIGLFIWL